MPSLTSPTKEEESGCTSIPQVPGKLIIDYTNDIHTNSLLGKYSYEYSYLISSLSPTKIATNLAKLFTSASTVG